MCHQFRPSETLGPPPLSAVGGRGKTAHTLTQPQPLAAGESSQTADGQGNIVEQYDLNIFNPTHLGSQQFLQSQIDGPVEVCVCSQHGQKVGYPPTTCTALNTKYIHVYIASFHSPSHTSSQCPFYWPEEPLPHTLHSAGYQPTGVGGRSERRSSSRGRTRFTCTLLPKWSAPPHEPSSS